MLAGWAVWLLLLSFPVISFPFISFHPISYSSISFPLTCHVPLGDDMNQHLNVDQWQNKTRERIKEEGGR